MADRTKALELLCQRVLSTRDQIGDAWAHHADPKTGKWNTVPTGDWVDGHWIQMLRMTGELLNRPELIEGAFRRTEAVCNKLEMDDMFRGHRAVGTHGAATRTPMVKRGADVHEVEREGAVVVHQDAASRLPELRLPVHATRGRRAGSPRHPPAALTNLDTVCDEQPPEDRNVNGAQSLFKALVDAGLDTCFSNPGTSEMQLVYEMGRTDDVRPILCLQENVVTGAADGYGRMAGKPAFTLLHVGSGFANGMANLHNAGRADTPVVNIVGANASYHQQNNPEHELIGGKITELTRAVSHWTHEAKSASDLAVLGTLAVRYSGVGSGKICSVIAPTECHWEPASGTPESGGEIAAMRVAPETIEEAAQRLRGDRKTALLVGGHALREEGLEAAARIASKNGVTLLAETFPARMARGEGRVSVTLVPYLVDLALEAFKEYDQVILLGARPPVATFAYLNMPTTKLPEGCELWTYATPDHDLSHALDSLVDALDARDLPVKRQAYEAPSVPAGELSPQAVAASVSLLMPEDAILVDEAGTMGPDIVGQTVGARRHDYLYSICGAAIGAGLPVALGASIACPERKVLAMQADGSAMYTVQALWSMARESCDITIVVLKNDKYAILNIELARVRETEPTDKMLSMMQLDHPSIDWVHIAEGMSIPATHARTAEEFHEQLEQALATTGPRLIEAAVTQDLQPAIDFIFQKSRGSYESI